MPTPQTKVPMLYAEQDGPDFYLFDLEDTSEWREPVEVVHSPFEFRDGDVREAEAARRWFEANRPGVMIA